MFKIAECWDNGWAEFKMNLKSFGCSFIYGSDLSDTIPNSPSPSSETWPALLARHLKREYKCHARPCSGNLRILESVLNLVPTSTKNDLYVIGWTWIDRFDYYDGHWNHERPAWRTIMPIDEDNLSKTYYRDLHSEYRDKLTCLSYMKLVIDTLDQQNIPFVMTFMDELMFDRRWNVTPGLQLLQDQVQPRMTDFEGHNFLDWSREHGFAESPTWHPLEQAHRAAADYMITVVDKQNTGALVPQVRA
jgi:hypothetical protein